MISCNESENSIGIFDSGIGGMTVFKEMLKILPYENYIYVGDSKNSPYGDRTTDDIKNLSLKIVDFLVSKNCKMIIIACNTIAAAAFEDIKLKYDIPVIEVVSNSVNTALSCTKNNTISVVATPFTVSTNIFANKIRAINANIDIKQIPCKNLCPMIEEGWRSSEKHIPALKEYLSEIPNNCDTIILGCTHYPIIIEDIKKYFSGFIVDSAVETSKEAFSILNKSNILNSKNNTSSNIEFYTTGDINKFRQFTENILSTERIFIKKLSL